MEFAESSCGARCTWNIWPASRIECSRLVVPPAVFLNPLKSIPDLVSIPYEPVRCKLCSAVLNPYCQVDYRGKIWACCFCQSRNQLPQAYHRVTETNLPAELFPQYTTVEYAPPSSTSLRPSLVFLIDTCLRDQELQDMKRTVERAMALLPDDALVAIIAFNSMVEVHELGYTACAKAYVLPGWKAASSHDLQRMLFLGLEAARAGIANMPSSGVGRFLLPVADCDLAVESVLSRISSMPDPPHGHRAKRCTGAALAAAVGLLESSTPGTGSRILLFTSGPCTVGPGKTVGETLDEPIRTHQDVEKGNAPWYKKGCKFYEGLAERMVDFGISLDVFAASLDQVGLAEMRLCAMATGGHIVLAEEYKHDAMRISLERLIQRDPATGLLSQGYNGTLEVFCPREVKICGASGCASLGKISSSVSDNVMGTGGTCQWRLCSADPSLALCVYFEVAAQHNSGAVQPGSPLPLQFVLRYRHASNQERVRVVTMARSWADPGSSEIVRSFDQEAAAVAMARLAVMKAEGGEHEHDVQRWLDRALIRLASKFGQYEPGRPGTFALPNEMKLFPQFMFHLRRSQFLQCANNTPDETCFYRCALLRHGVEQSMVMIQPTLLTYSFSGPPAPALLDAAAIRPDSILLLDTWFKVVIHYGSTIAAWRKAGYADMPEHEAFRQLLAAPLEDARVALDERRVPPPSLVECDQGGSQARFLLAKLNPSQGVDGYGEVIYTDDVSLQVFLESLAKMVTQ
ncbi:unnamed protein product [Pedinophyceae sp. YPF-701]|nr:unnamed protein product [Pedinophyceae sp. YPF-701]